MRPSLLLALLALPACPSPPPVPAFITYFRATPDAVSPGEAVELSWSADDAKSCTIAPDVGVVAPKGTAQVTPAASTTFVLTCGGVTAQRAVTVRPRVAIARFEAAPASTVVDSVVTLSWEAAAATACAISPGVGLVPATGTATAAVLADTTFTLSCDGLGGPATSSAPVTVAAVTSLDAPAGLTVTPGDGTVVLRWTQPFGASNLYFAEEPGVTKAGVAQLRGGLLLQHVRSPFEVTGLVAGRTYYARVSATSGTVESELSAEASGQAGAGTPVDDPYFAAQWHLENTGQTSGLPGEDVRAKAAWAATRGEGVRIAIVDDGIDPGHEDLAQNVAQGRSHDYLGNAALRLSQHGTCVAGLAAARDLNGKGVRGVAPRANLVSYNVLQDLTAANELDAMVRDAAANGVSNNSWGDAEDGTGLLTRSEPLWRQGVAQGTAVGRGGKGLVYLWASGNGADAEFEDDANYDGQANDRHVLAIGGVDDQGKWVGYAEGGANVLVAAPTEGLRRAALTTTDTTGALGYNDGRTAGEHADANYSSTMNGTSASTPVAAGVVALVLAARPELTWRDVRRVLAYSARKNDPTDVDWEVNGAGLHVSHKVGFGAVDAAAAVAVARSFVPGDPERTFSTARQTPAAAVPDGEPGGASSSVDVAGSGVGHVEFVEVVVKLTHPRTGDLDVALVHLGGARSVVHKPHDCAPDPRSGREVCSPIVDYVFGSVRHLDEPADGQWTLTVRDLKTGNTGTLDAWQLNFYGRP